MPLDEVGGSNHADLSSEYAALAVKALLLHGAVWGPKGQFLDEHFQPQDLGSHFARRDDITRLLGYGVPKIDRVVDCATFRALTVIPAWFSPVNTRHQGYRMAALDVTPRDRREILDGIDSTPVTTDRQS